MTRRCCFALVGLLALLVASAAQTQAQAQEACAALPARPVPSRESRPEYIEWQPWRDSVAALSQRLAGIDTSHARLVFLGDSILDGFQADLFRQFYGHRAAVNLSIAGDITQGVLWRLSPRRATAQDQAGGGQWPASLKPRLAVVLLGTNNTLQNRDAAEVALGIAEVVRMIRRRSPTTRILLVGILPRGADTSEPLRAVGARVNDLIARCADNATVFYTNPGPMLLDGQGRLAELIAPDRLHPSWIGYAILAAALEPQIRHLLGE